MPVTEVVRALGSFDVKLRPTTPKHLVDLLDRHRFGRLVVDAGRDNPELLGDALLRSARYVGVLRDVMFEQAGITVSGCGMGMWLGDEDGVGDSIEAAVTIGGLPFPGAIRALLPPSGCVVEGTLHDIPGASYQGSHAYQSRRAAIDYVCKLFGADWRVNGDATLDAGMPDDLFVTEPQAAIIAQDAGWDMGLTALPGSAKMDRTAADFTTRVVTVATGDNRTVAVGKADIVEGLNVYKDPFGNPVKRTRLISENNTSLIGADARAQLQLDNYTAPTEAITLTSATHDIRGTIAAGDYVWVYDPAANLVDHANEVVFRGDRIWPVKLRTTQLTWPIVAGMGVYFRTGDGQWVDLTDHVVFDSAGSVTITVGGANPDPTSSLVTAPGSQVVPDRSVPAAPSLVLPWKTSIYKSATSVSNARIVVAWNRPSNTDGTVIRDGSHYEVQYRKTGAAEWLSQVTSFDFTTLQLLGLDVAQAYEVRVRAVDIASPPNTGSWSDTVQITTPGDTIPPATPAAPTVASSETAVQVVHTLGASDGGEYNLDPDLDHLEVHASPLGPGYTPDATTLLGTMPATLAMMAATVSAIGTFTVTDTAALWVKVVAVDESGNRSAASVAAQSTTLLIPSANIGDLTADKIVGGTFKSAYSLTGLFRTAVAGARFEAGTNDDDLNGFRLYRPSGTLALNGDAATGDFLAYQPDGTKPTFRIQAATGNVYLYKSDGTTPALTLTASTGLVDMAGKLTAGDTARVVIDPAYLLPQSASDIRPAIVLASENEASPGPAYIAVNDRTTGGDDYLTISSGPSAASGAFTRAALRLYADKAVLQVDDGTNQANRGGSLYLDENSAILYVATAGTSADVPEPGSANINIDGTAGIIVVTAAGGAQLGSDVNNRVTCSPTGSQLISGGTVKSFVIDHPSDPDRLLVHACLEGDTSGVIYRGTVQVVDHMAVVQLPPYFEALTAGQDRQVLLQPELAVFEGKPMVPTAAPTEIQDGRFYVICPAPDGTRVHWQVTATRNGAEFPVEPLRTEVTVAGDGPYRYLAA